MFFSQLDLELGVVSELSQIEHLYTLCGCQLLRNSGCGHQFREQGIELCPRFVVPQICCSPNLATCVGMKLILPTFQLAAN